MNQNNSKRHYAVFFLLVFSIASCVTKQALEDPLGIASNADSTLPAFYTSPPVGDQQYIYGIGSAQLPSHEESKIAALEMARQDVAIQITQTIHTAIDEYAAALNINSQLEIVSLGEELSNAIVQELWSQVLLSELSETVQGSVYTLAVLPTSTLLISVENNLQNSKTSILKPELILKYLESILSGTPPQAGQILPE